MSIMMNDYQRSWALRYLREAKAEFAAAQKIPSLASDLILEAMRKAQAAIYYSLGEPAFIETIIRQKTREQRFISDPILRCLVEIERAMKQVVVASELDEKRAIKQADNILRIASDIVELLTDERT